MKGNGFSLIELLAVITIMGIVAGLGTVSYRAWVSRHEVEKQVKEIYADLGRTRIAAMRENRSHFITLEANKLRAYRDTDPDGTDGDGVLTVGKDAFLCMWSRGFHDGADADCAGGGLSFRNLAYNLSWSGEDVDTIQFTARGLAAPNSLKTICVFSAVNPSYDCIKVFTTRIIMGKITNQGGKCINDNCQEKR
ncbi:pilus assembly FimT family protein [Syntrophorhabdus aromaticivorans]|uniref:pilus assembly FimT family protein n=1 Tax=Syntrophorhabdus aromaticivorans TaxID=328301 RepID=UPI00040439A8|nr:type II secretion system protein [Syntrophorhabdus aromaticivorans]